MWIISKLSGVINSNLVTRFTENSFGTYAYFNSLSFQITEERILATIVDALKSGQDFLEVE